MKRNCGNCRESKRHGLGSQVYCTFYGIIISRSYDRCHRQEPKIIEVESETDRDRVRADFREEGA